MTALRISPSTLQSLGWALLHFLWQGTALAALAAAVMAPCRRTAVRYQIGVLLLALMLLTPLATFVFLVHQPAVGLQNPKTFAPNTIEWPKAGVIAADHLIRLSSSAPSLDAIPWLVEAWLLGVALLGLRSAGGFILAERLRLRRSSVVNQKILEICYTLQDRLGITRAIDYCECKWLHVPAVIGWFRPVVFLPGSAVSGLSEDQLKAVVAHELAHIQRLDPFVNVFQVCVETLLFYHPAIWWLNKRIRAEREYCCDEVAVAVSGNAVAYARALTMMDKWRGAPAVAMAANRGPLTERIVRILGLKTLSAGMRSIGLSGSVLCLAVALAAGNAMLIFAHPSSARASSSGQASLQQEPSASPRPAAKSTVSPRPSARQGENRASSTSYIDEMKAAGLPDLSVDELIGLRTQGVTPEYVRAMHDLGLQLDADGLIGMKVQGVTPEYIREIRALGFNPDEDQITGMKVQGITTEYVRGMKNLGLQGDADQIIGMRVQGVTPDYVRELRTLGLKVDADDIIGLKVQGVTPAYVQALQAQGFRPDANEVVGMKVQGVTPEYVRDIRALGLNPKEDVIVRMKVQGVTPEYIKALQAAGFKPSIDDIVGAKVQGITPAFINRVRNRGFQNLTIEKLIELKHLGIFDGKGEI